MLMPERKIPKGFYCYSKNKAGKTKVCPFWSINASQSSHANGYCAYLGKGDWEMTEVSGLWDMKKECGKNKFENKEIEKIFEKMMKKRNMYVLKLPSIKPPTVDGEL